MDNVVSDNQTQSISDDQELAKALAGVNQEADAMTFEETNSPVDNGVQAGLPPVTAPDPVATPVVTAPDPVATTPLDSNLADVKQAALSELRPLISKLDVSPEEKFDTYLLLIRSTDDQDLIAPAHEAAKSITDEAQKAQALLDIIKEIDFLSKPQQ